MFQRDDGAWANRRTEKKLKEEWKAYRNENIFRKVVWSFWIARLP
jgi:hypothetical protein